MLEKNKKIGGMEMLVDLLFIAFFSASYILPSFSFNFMIPMALALAYRAYIGIGDRRIGAHIVLCLLMVLLLALMYSILTDTKTISSNVDNIELKQYLSKANQYLMMFFPMLLSHRIITRYPRKAKLWILVVAGVIFAYVFASTLSLLIEEQNAVRHWDDFSGLAEQDIGTYDFVYAVPIIICTLAVCNIKFNVVGKILNVVAIVLCFIFLINAEYTLALLIAMIGLILVAYTRGKTTAYKVMFVLIGAIGLFFVPLLLKLMYTYLPEGDISLRIREIYNFLVLGDVEGYNLSSRLSLYGRSIEAFFNSPIFGNRRLDFDGHGTFLTIPADTGIMGILFMGGLLFSTRRYVKAILGEHNRQFMPIFGCFVLMGTVNPVHATDALSFSMWFVAPLVIDYFFNKEESDNAETPC